MLKDMVESGIPIDITDIVADALEKQRSVGINIGELRLYGVITKLDYNHITIKMKDIDISVIL